MGGAWNLQVQVAVLLGFTVHGEPDATEWGRLRKARLTDMHRQRSRGQHSAIIDAIVARDQDQAEAAMRDHLISVQKALLGSDYGSDDIVAIDAASEAGRELKI